MVTVNVIITLKEIYIGNPILVKYNRYVHCEDCDGTGFDRESLSYQCEVCEGKDSTCKYCLGRGEIYTDKCKK